MHNILLSRIAHELGVDSDELSFRADGRIEWIDPNTGIGHTVWVPVKHRKEKSWWCHGCDGVCQKFKEKIRWS